MRARNLRILLDSMQESIAKFSACSSSYDNLPSQVLFAEMRANEKSSGDVITTDRKKSVRNSASSIVGSALTTFLLTRAPQQGESYRSFHTRHQVRVHKARARPSKFLCASRSCDPVDNEGKSSSRLEELPFREMYAPRAGAGSLAVDGLNECRFGRPTGSLFCVRGACTERIWNGCMSCGRLVLRMLEFVR